MVAASQFEEPMQMNEAEYLAFGEQSAIKHEFVNGKVFAMTQVTLSGNYLICRVPTIARSILTTLNYIYEIGYEKYSYRIA